MKTFKQFLSDSSDYTTPKYTRGKYDAYPRDTPFIITPDIKKKGLDVWKFMHGLPMDFVKKQSKKIKDDTSRRT